MSSGTGTLGNATASTNGAGLATFAGLTISGVVGSYPAIRRAECHGDRGERAHAQCRTGEPCHHHGATATDGLERDSAVSVSGGAAPRWRGEPGASGRQVHQRVDRIGYRRHAHQYRRHDRRDRPATFTGLTLSGTSGNFTIGFGGAGLTSAASNQVALGAGSGSLLSITTQPSASAQNGVAFAQQPAIQLRDGSNNPVNQPNVVVSVAIVSGGGTLNGAGTALTNASGLATFTGLSTREPPATAP